MAILAQPRSAAKAAVKIIKQPAPTSTAPVSVATGGNAVRTSLPSVQRVAGTPNAAAAMTNQQRLATDPSYKTSETQRALDVIAQRQAQGQDISLQQKYLQKNLGYTGIIPAATAAPTNMLNNYVPIVSQQQQNTMQSQDLFRQALQTLNQQNPQQQQLQELMQQYATREQTPFAYDRNTDPNYAAGLAAAQSNIQTGQNAAMAELNRRGILNSTITGDRAAQISADAYGALETQMLPQYYQQAFQMWQAQQNAENQQFQNQYNLANMYDTQRQNEFTNQRGLATDYNTLAQQDFQNRLSTADRTGVLQTAEVETAIQNIQALKQLASAKGITKEQRDAYSKQADMYRAQLDAAGVDSKQFGSNVTSAQAAQRSQAGTSTIQAQQLALQNKQFNVDTALRYGDQSGRLLTPQSDPSGYLRQIQNGAPQNLAGQNQSFNQGMETRKQNFTEESFVKEFNERVRATGVDEALRWADQKFRETSFDRTQTEVENQNAISNDQWSQTFAYQKVRDSVADSQWQTQFDEDTRRFGLNYALDQLVTNNQITQSEADSARANAQLELQQDQFAYGMAQDQQAANQGQTAESYNQSYLSGVAQYADVLDQYGKSTGQKKLSNPDDVKRAILTSELSEYEQYRLYQLYGFGWSGDVPKKPAAPTNNTIGNLAKKYESSGNPSTIARNPGDIGGASYGTYQITQGTMPGFLSYLKSSGNPLANVFNGVKIASNAFDAAWRNAAAQNGGQALKDAEEGFIKQSHYDPAAKSIAKATGVDVNKRSNALQQVLYSVSVQHGPGGAKNVFKGAGINNKMTDEQIIRAVYRERSANNGMKYFKSSSPSIRAGVLGRFKKEEQDAISLL